MMLKSLFHFDKHSLKSCFVLPKGYITDLHPYSEEVNLALTLSITQIYLTLDLYQVFNLICKSLHNGKMLFVLKERQIPTKWLCDRFPTWVIQHTTTPIRSSDKTKTNLVFGNVCVFWIQAVPWRRPFISFILTLLTGSLTEHNDKGCQDIAVIIAVTLFRDLITLSPTQQR